jgi:hypothetical protein
MLYLTGPKTTYTVVVKAGHGIQASSSETLNTRKHTSLQTALHDEQKYNGNPLAWDFLLAGKYYSESQYGMLIAVVEIGG